MLYVLHSLISDISNTKERLNLYFGGNFVNPFVGDIDNNFVNILFGKSQPGGHTHRYTAACLISNHTRSMNDEIQIDFLLCGDSPAR